jgi:hypothetical protein
VPETKEESKLPGKKVQLELVGLDGNAFSLMGAFQRQARREGWSREEIDQVLEECQSGDYDHLLCTLIEVCESPEVEVDDDEDGDKDEDEEDDEE